MNPKKLTSEELAVFDVIAMQCGENLPGWFEYDYMRAQKYLVEKGYFAEYGINLQRHISIAEQLSKKHIIQMGGIGSRKNHKPEEGGIIWESPIEWINECAELVRREGPGVDANQKYTIFMQVSYDTIQYINNNYKASYLVQLRITDRYPCIDIKINQGKWIHLERMSDSGVPIKVLRRAYRNRGKIVTRSYLQKVGINIGNKYLRSQVFEKNGTVQALIPLLLKIDKDSIMFPARPIKLTLTQLNDLKAKLGIA